MRMSRRFGAAVLAAVAGIGTVTAVAPGTADAAAALNCPGNRQYVRRDHAGIVLGVWAVVDTFGNATKGYTHLIDFYPGERKYHRSHAIHGVGREYLEISSRPGDHVSSQKFFYRGGNPGAKGVFQTGGTEDGIQVPEGRYAGDRFRGVYKVQGVAYTSKWVKVPTRKASGNCG